MIKNDLLINVFSVQTYNLWCMASIQGQMSKCIMSHDDKITDKSKNVRDENRIRLGT